VVSHDRYFLDRVVDRILAFETEASYGSMKAISPAIWSSSGTKACWPMISPAANPL
jgi:hypothetical protein